MSGPPLRPTVAPGRARRRSPRPSAIGQDGRGGPRRLCRRNAERHWSSPPPCPGGRPPPWVDRAARPRPPPLGRRPPGGGPAGGRVLGGLPPAPPLPTPVAVDRPA